MYSIFYVPNKPETAQSVEQIIPTQLPKNKNREIAVNNEHFNYSLFSVTNISSVTLIPNFSKKESSTTIMEKNNCKQAINGGFYDKHNNPLGLFISDSQKIGQQIPSTLLNGF